MKNKYKTHRYIKLAWIITLCVALYLYFFQREFVDSQIIRIADTRPAFRYSVYLILGALRGFTLIPVTYLIILGFIFIPLKPLYLLTMAGVAISSISIYYFSDFLNLSGYFERKYPRQVAKLKSVMKKDELPIVILWSMLPFAPTDVICYVCGSLEVGLRRFALGVLIGEGITCALYIFFGKEIMSFILRFI